MLVVSHRHGHLRFRELRRARRNRHLQATEVAALLWRAETLAALAAVDAANGCRRWRRGLLQERLVETLPLRELRAVVRDKLKQRTWWHETTAVA